MLVVIQLVKGNPTQVRLEPMTKHRMLSIVSKKN
jgi:hypothetical protein